MEVVWNGTRASGLNPSIYDRREPYREPVCPAAPAPPPGRRKQGRGTRGQILEYLGTVAKASVAEICAALDAHDRRDYQRVAAMVGYLKTSGVLAATTRTGVSSGGRGYRFHVYAIARKARS